MSEYLPGRRFIPAVPLRSGAGPLRNELIDVGDADAQGFGDAGHRARPRLPGAALQVADRPQGDAGGLSELLLGPALKAAQAAERGHWPQDSGALREHPRSVRY